VTGNPRSDIIAEVTGARKEAIEYLLGRRMFGSFLLIRDDLDQKRIDLEWVRIEKVNARLASVSHASHPSHFNWSYMDDYDIPRTVGEAVTDAVHAVKQAISGPPK
jgi:hypothetical protein